MEQGLGEWGGGQLRWARGCLSCGMISQLQWCQDAKVSSSKIRRPMTVLDIWTVKYTLLQCHD